MTRHLSVESVLHYPLLSFIKISEDSKYNREKSVKGLNAALIEKKEDVKFERKIIVTLPDNEDHQGHFCKQV